MAGELTMRPGDSSLLARVLAARLPLLELGLFGWALLFVVKDPWVGDFFEHAAVVRELAAHPLQPGHPLLPVDAPHPFYSPYAWLLGLFTRFTGASPIRVLALAGLFNLALLLVGLRRFAGLWASPEREQAAAFYTLTFVLLLWGSSVWLYSGFFHLAAIGLVLPYPSAFAAGLSLVALRAYGDLLRRTSAAPREGLPTLAGVALAAGWVVLSHPHTFVFLMCGLGAVTLAYARVLLREGATLAGVIAVAVLLASLWPLYPWIDLVASGAGVFHEANREMYQQVLSRVGLAWLGVPVLAFRLWSNPRDGLALCALSLAAVYALGGLSERWSYGRVIVYLALCMQVGLAVALADFEARVASWNARSALAGIAPITQIGLATSLVLALVTLQWSELVRPSLARIQPDAATTLSRFGFLTQHLSPGDVVLADLVVAGMPPALAGKVIAYNRPQPFVQGHAEREADVARFFAAQTDAQERHEILGRYRPDFVLHYQWDPDAVEALASSLSPEMRILHWDGDFVLFGKAPVGARSESGGGR